MIFIKRSNDAATLPLYRKATVKAADGTSKITRYQRERDAAIDFFSNTANYLDNKKLVEKSFGFKVYKDKELAKILSCDFRKKCAYCESKFGAVTSSDIEHYRPKASIGSGASELKPGYYWLAGDWENLLISCPLCNRVRNHEVPGQTREVLLGKGSQFPLADEAGRVRKHDGDVANEDSLRLLLHPCIDQPEKFLVFDDRGLVYPAGDAAESQRGKVSIEVYALQRKDLVEARLDEINELRSKVDDLQRLVRGYNAMVAEDSSEHLLTEKLDHIEKVVRGINAMMSPTAQYLAIKRNWIQNAHSKGEFADLEKFGIRLEHLAITYA